MRFLGVDFVKRSGAYRAGERAVSLRGPPATIGVAAAGVAALSGIAFRLRN